jgi:hypothetical protein
MRWSIFTLLFLLGCPGPSPDPIELPSEDCVIEYSLEMLEHADEDLLCELSYDALTDPNDEEWTQLHDAVWDSPSGELSLLCGTDYPSQQSLLQLEAIRAMRCVWLCQEYSGSNSTNCDYE